LKRADEAFNQAFALNPDLAIARTIFTRQWSATREEHNRRW
jgi:hypothetical protein